MEPLSAKELNEIKWEFYTFSWVLELFEEVLTLFLSHNFLVVVVVGLLTFLLLIFERRLSNLHTPVWLTHQYSTTVMIHTVPICRVHYRISISYIECLIEQNLPNTQFTSSFCIRFSVNKFLYQIERERFYSRGERY